jgi:hypothetical protein
MIACEFGFVTPKERLSKTLLENKNFPNMKILNLHYITLH